MTAYSAVDIARALGAVHLPTPEQEAVIEAPLGPMLVVAGAGSGKTETMAARVVWLVANGHVQPDEVLGLTFTRKAASELAERIGLRLARLEAVGLWRPAAVDGVPALDSAPTVSTYHSYAGRLVREHALRLGHEPDARLLTEAAAWQYAAEAVAAHDGPMDVMDKRESTVTAAVVHLSGELAEHLREPAEAIAVLDDVIAELAALAPAGGPPKTSSVGVVLANLRLRRAVLPIVERFAALKRSRDALDFADQMALAARLATGFPDVGAIERQRFRAVLLDEFQDTSEAQMELLRALFAVPGGAVPVTAVGDPNQSIYGWRGASATTLARFPTAFAADRPTLQRPLSTSWRNDDRVLQVANAVAAPLREAARVPVDRLRARPGAGPGSVEVARLTTSLDEAAHVAAWLEGVRARVPGASAAVLCRKRSQFRLVVDALEERGIPHEVLGLGGLLTTPEVQDVIALLHVVADPARGDHLMRLLTGPICHLGAADLDGLHAWAAMRQQLVTAEGDHRGRDLEPGSTLDTSLVEALADLPPAAWRGRHDERVSVVGLDRLRGLAGVVHRMRGQTALGLAELVGEAERALGLDIEVLARPEYTPAAARAHLDAFADVAASFALGSERPTLTAFLAWLEAAEQEERGLDKGYVEPTPGAVQVLTIHSAKGLEWDAVAVPGLVEGTFPAHSAQTGSRPDPAVGWAVGRPNDKGWCGGLQDGGIPYALRGDRDGLPRLRWQGRASLAEANKEVDGFFAAGGAHGIVEERRLAYVALTRARHALLLTAHVWGTQKLPRVTSRFLTEVVTDDELSAHGALTRGPWADLPPVDGSPVANPLDAVEQVVQWPVDPMAARRRAVAAGAARVTAAMTADEEGEPAGPDRREVVAATSPDRVAEADLLLAERAERRARDVEVVDLPPHLSTSALVALADDRDAFTAALRRPMPAPPALTARRGTAFHAWVEQHYASAAIVDIDELPGSADEDAGPVDDLPTMKANFLASEWAARTPHALEVAVETVIDGTAVRGRIDAVFDLGDAADGPRWVIVDWKTGMAPTGRRAEVRALQLAAYAVAWARLQGVDPATVRGAFFHAATGETTWPVLADEADLARLLRDATAADTRSAPVPPEPPRPDPRGLPVAR